MAEKHTALVCLAKLFLPVSCECGPGCDGRCAYKYSEILPLAARGKIFRFFLGHEEP